MDKNDNFDEIIDMERPWTEETLKKHPKMSPQDRAKIFAPFAALRGHSERLGEEDVKMLRSERMELSEDEAAMLSDKLLQVKKGMTITVVYFQPDSENGDIGYNVTATGTVSNIDPVYRILKIDTGRTNEKGSVDEVIKFDDLLDVSGSEIVDIDKYLGTEDFPDEYGEYGEYGEYSENSEYPKHE
ncbi:MAG: YolD-like family protein [Oscillospiraceae bacterium]|nr:YolD-like family protein [Oscillospiraceae bacterium]